MEFQVLRETLPRRGFRALMACCCSLYGITLLSHGIPLLSLSCCAAALSCRGADLSWRAFMACRCSHASFLQRASARVVAAVMNLRRRGGLRRATLYAVDEALGQGGEAKLQDCVADADGKV
jgi:hypothetical protein